MEKVFLGRHPVIKLEARCTGHLHEEKNELIISYETLRHAPVGTKWRVEIKKAEINGGSYEEQIELTYRSKRGFELLLSSWGMTDYPVLRFWENTPKIIWVEDAAKEKTA